MMTTFFQSLILRLYNFFLKKRFNAIGESSYFRLYPDLLVGQHLISIGDRTVIGRHVQLTAWAAKDGKDLACKIEIGSNSQIGSYNHITAINKIEIGNGVLTGKFVTISDNSHGKPGDVTEKDISPIKRAVFSKGPVVIEDNVWIGDKATILANVRIGKGCIVGANAVVTKDVPPYTIVAGSPAKIIKHIRK